MSTTSIQKAVPTLLAVAVISMMVTINAGPAAPRADRASSEPTPYSADHSRIAADSGTQESSPTF